MAAAAAWSAPDPPPAVTMRELVDIAQRHKADEWAAAAARLAGRAPAENGRPRPWPASAREDAEAPRLWTLQAIGPRWRAEVLHQGRVHRLDAPVPASVRIGGWRVVDLAPEGLVLERASVTPRGPRRLVLAPPCRGTLAQGYGFEASPAREAEPLAQALPSAGSEHPQQDAVRRAAGLPPAAQTAPEPGLPP